MLPTARSCATATGGQRSNAKMIIEFRGSVKTEEAVAVGSSAVLGHGVIISNPASAVAHATQAPNLQMVAQP
jgi:hypothetical protein